MLRKKITISLLFTFIVLVMAFPVTVSASTITLTGVIRDFHASHPDFESYLGTDPGIVEETLGVDQKPVYAGLAGNPSTHGQEYFDQWYRDAPGINTSMLYAISLDNTITSDPNVYTYTNSSFFPIDNQLFGNEGNNHNYHFTFELHSMFTYSGGETFSFTGDDDVWVYINNQLVVDLGGVHSAMTGSVDLDALGLVEGQTYSFDLFFAERHTTQSSFRIDTSIVMEQPPAVPIPGAVWLLGSGLCSLIGLRRRFLR